MKIILNDQAADATAAPGEVPRKAFEWKWVAIGGSLLAVVLILSLTYKRDVKLPSGTIAFQTADVALLPGPGWTTITSGELTRVQDICLPVLLGMGRFTGCTIEVIAPANAPADPAKMASNLAAALSRDPNIVTNSVGADPFITASGLAGIRVSAHIRVKDANHEDEIVACSYIVANAKGRCVRINFTSPKDPNGVAADEMIRRTLALR